MNYHEMNGNSKEMQQKEIDKANHTARAERTEAAEKVFWLLSDFVSPHLVLNHTKHFCSILTGIMQYL